MKKTMTRRTFLRSGTAASVGAIATRPLLVRAFAQAGFEAGKVELIGGTYGQPMGTTISGESNIRQIVVGRNVIRKALGYSMVTFLEEEEFTHPQILQIALLAGRPPPFRRPLGCFDSGDQVAAFRKKPGSGYELRVVETEGRRTEASIAVHLSLTLWSQFDIQSGCDLSCLKMGLGKIDS